MRSCWIGYALLGLLTAPPLLRADPPIPAPLKLDAALAQAQPSPGEVALAVGAARVPLPDGATLPGVPLTGQEVGALYGRTTQPFGEVVAIAPPTMTVVYSPPETPNPYDGMPPSQVMKLLTQTFTPAQWKAFLSQSGVGYAEMQGETQPPLFQALFPGGHLVLIEDNPTGENDPKTQRDLSGDTLLSAHLRLGSMTSLALQMTGNTDGHMFANGLRPAGSPARFFMMNSPSSDVDREFGAQVRETVPNALKAGQIAFDDPALKAAVPLGGIKTVDDLIIRICRAAKREIYADPRYAARMVTLSPAGQSAPAADLLQALALCVGGTYRRVGPAWVLTDDVVGLGTKHALWKAFEDKAQSMLPDSSDFSQTGPNPALPYTVKDIMEADDPLAFTPEQRDRYWKEWAANPGQSSSVVMDVTVPFEQLSSAQQEAAEMIQTANEKDHNKTTLSGTVMVQEEPEVEVLLPEVNGPVVIFQSYQSLLPYPALTPAQEQAQQKRMERDFPEITGDPNVPAPDFGKTLRGFTRRAALFAPKTPKETVNSLSALSALGFSEAWLQIRPGPASADAEARARLALAVTAGRRLGIRVFPDISLLHWQEGTDPALLDCDLEGKTVLPLEVSSFSPAVSPFAPAVTERLTALVRSLSSVPGLGGMVWEDTLSPGYEAAVQGENIGRFDDALGYSEAGRLAFLRQDHADPVDTCDNSYTNERAHVHVPGFDSDSKEEQHLFQDWKKSCADAGQALMRHLAVSLTLSFTGTTPRLPLLLPPSNALFVTSFGSWDDLSSPPPIVRFIPQTGSDGQVLMGVPNTERMSSALSYKKLLVFVQPAAPPQVFLSAAARALVQAAKRGDRNILVDMTGQPGLLEGSAKLGK